MLLLRIKRSIIFLLNLSLCWQLWQLRIKVLLYLFDLFSINHHITIDVFRSFLLELELFWVVEIFDLFFLLSFLKDYFIVFAILVTGKGANCLHELVSTGSTIFKGLSYLHITRYFLNIHRIFTFYVLWKFCSQFNEQNLHFEESQTNIPLNQFDIRKMNMIPKIACKRLRSIEHSLFITACIGQWRRLELTNNL